VIERCAEVDAGANVLLRCGVEVLFWGKDRDSRSSGNRGKFRGGLGKERFACVASPALEGRRWTRRNCLKSWQEGTVSV
jgi:hypothetical protein